MKMHGIEMEELPGIMDKLSVKYRAIAAIGVTTGCRISEILCLKRGDLLNPDGSFREKVPFVKLKAIKRDRAKKAERIPVRHRYMSIPEPFLSYVREHLKAEERKGWERPDNYVFRGRHGEHMSRIRAWRIFRNVMGQGFGTHWMRKTFAQKMFVEFQKMEDSDINSCRLVQAALGHERIDTTIKYLELRDHRIADAQRAAFG